jgi:hypothetical protein
MLDHDGLNLVISQEGQESPSPPVPRRPNPLPIQVRALVSGQGPGRARPSGRPSSGDVHQGQRSDAPQRAGDLPSHPGERRSWDGRLGSAHLFRFTIARMAPRSNGSQPRRWAILPGPSSSLVDVCRTWAVQIVHALLKLGSAGS